MTAESPAYRAAVHTPPCESDQEHAIRVIAEMSEARDALLWDLSGVARLLADSREDECDVPAPVLPALECE